jgi:hypothetical protein
MDLVKAQIVLEDEEQGKCNMMRVRERYVIMKALPGGNGAGVFMG